MLKCHGEKKKKKINKDHHQIRATLGGKGGGGGSWLAFVSHLMLWMSATTPNGYSNSMVMWLPPGLTGADRMETYMYVHVGFAPGKPSAKKKSTYIVLLAEVRFGVGRSLRSSSTRLRIIITRVWYF